MTKIFLSERIDFVKAYLGIIYFMPCFFGYTSLNKGQMIYLVVYFIISLFFASIALFRKFVDIRYTIPVFLILAFHYSLSSIMNFSDNNVMVGDIMEILRPIIYFLSFLLPVMIFQPYVRKYGLYYYTDFFEKIVFFSSFIEFFKYLDPLKQFFYLYTPFEFGSINYIRLSGFTGFAYAYAWILLICIILNAFKTNGRVSFRFLYYSLILIGTGSRTGIFALFLLYFLLFLLLKRMRLRLFFLVIFILLSVLLLYKLEIPVFVTGVDYAVRLVQTFLGNAGDGSLQSRQAQMNKALIRFYESPLFGTASNKTNNVPIENFYFHHLGTWGFLGLVLYLLWLSCFRIYLVTKEKKQIFAFIIGISFVICFSSPIFDQVRIFNIFYAIIALLLINSTNNETKKCKIS